MPHMSDFDVRRLNLNLLVALEALLIEGSVSGAARRTHVTQSAMSHSLARLREALDDPILAPAGRRLAPTAKARRIAERLPRALDRLGDALGASERFDPLVSRRTFRIATLDYFELATLPETLAFLATHAPGIKLEIERLASHHLDALARGAIDLVLAGAGLPAPPSVRRQVLFADPFSVIVRADHPRVGRTMTLKRYLELGHVLVSVEGRPDGAVDRALEARGLRREVVVRVPHFLSAPLVVQRSDLVCTLASAVAERAKELVGVRVLRPPLPLPSAEVALYWPTSVDDDPAARWLRELFVSGEGVSARLRARIEARRRAR